MDMYDFTFYYYHFEINLFSRLYITMPNGFINTMRARVQYIRTSVSAWVILAHVAWPRAQPLGQSVSLKFSLETRLESESFEPLIQLFSVSGSKVMI